MKTTTHEGRVIVTFNFRRTDLNWTEKGPRQASLALRGGRLFITEGAEDRDLVTNRLDELKDWTNVTIGPKLFVRLIQSALDGTITGAIVKSPYSMTMHDGGTRGVLEFAPSKTKPKTHIVFRAPCGATGELTRREAEKLVEAVKSL